MKEWVAKNVRSVHDDTLVEVEEVRTERYSEEKRGILDSLTRIAAF